MRQRIILSTLWACGTFALAMALGIPSMTSAVDGSNSPGTVATILTPRLIINGAELTLTQDSAATQPSQGTNQLKLTVRAQNKTAASISGDFTIRLTSVAPSSPLSRTLPIPTEFWANAGSFRLNAGQAKTFVFTPPALLPNFVYTAILGSPYQQVDILSMVEKNGGKFSINP